MKSYLLTFLSFLVYFAVSAQDTKPELMLDGGVNSTHVRGAAPIAGVSASARVRIPLSSRFGVSTGLGFNSRNFNWSGTFACGVDWINNRRVTFVDERFYTVGVPVIADFRLLSSPVIIDAGAGTAINFVVGGSRWVRGGCEQIDVTQRRLFSVFPDLIVQTRAGFPIGESMYIYLQPTLLKSFAIQRRDAMPNSITLAASLGVAYKLGEKK